MIIDNETNDLEILMQNEERLKNAREANISRPSQSHYDTHHYGNEYYKKPKAEKDRAFNTIALKIAALIRLGDLLPKYFDENKPPSNDEKKEIKILHKYEDNFLSLIPLLTNYVIIHSNSIIEEDLKKKLQSLEEKNLYLKQESVGFSNELDDNSQKFEKWEERYGETSLITDVIFWFYGFDDEKSLEEKINEKVTNITQFKKTEEYKKPSSEIYEIVELIKNQTSANKKGFDFQQNLEFLFSLKDKNFDENKITSFPELAKQMALSQNQKNNILKQLIEKLSSEPELIENQNIEFSDFIFNKIVEVGATSLLHQLIEKSSVEQISNLMHHESPISGSIILKVFPQNENYLNNDSMLEKQKETIKTILNQFKEIGRIEIADNNRIYYAIKNYAKFLQESKPEELAPFLSLFEESIPDYLGFTLNHEVQMMSLYSFLRNLFLKMLKPKFISNSLKEKLVSWLENRDHRYPDIQKKYDYLVSDIKRIEN